MTLDATFLLGWVDQILDQFGEAISNATEEDA